MRVVLDTNVLARALSGGSSPAAEVLDVVLVQPHVLVASEFLLNELGRVLCYPRLKRTHGLNEALIDRYVQSLRGLD